MLSCSAVNLSFSRPGQRVILANDKLLVVNERPAGSPPYLTDLAFHSASSSHTACAGCVNDSDNPAYLGLI